MSSTAITLKQLSDDGELGSQHGRLAVGILLFQDLATLPFLVLVGVGQGQGFSGPTLVRELVLAAAALVLIAVVARPLFRTALSWAAHGHPLPLEGRRVGVGVCWPGPKVDHSAARLSLGRPEELGRHLDVRALNPEALSPPRSLTTLTRSGSAGSVAGSRRIPD
jgi:hypothetical protein